MVAGFEEGLKQTARYRSLNQKRFPGSPTRENQEQRARAIEILPPRYVQALIIYFGQDGQDEPVE